MSSPYSTLWNIVCCEGHSKPTVLSTIVATASLIGGLYFLIFSKIVVLGIICICIGVLGLGILYYFSTIHDDEVMQQMADDQAKNAAGFTVQRTNSLVGRLLLQRMNSATRRVEKSGHEEAKNDAGNKDPKKQKSLVNRLLINRLHSASRRIGSEDHAKVPDTNVVVRNGKDPILIPKLALDSQE